MIREAFDIITHEKFYEPIIIDFGFAENMNSKWKPQKFYNVGSPTYMAPESYNLTKYSPKSDLWALGVVFFEILTGNTFDESILIDDLFKYTAAIIDKRLS